ncbi:MAG TPA: glycerophosphodiester phosphodiesterase family protein [Bacilli bacterium]|nr:glycerophosphodiester phosphodiesterase family protein [Bacilli bacterium]
MSNIDHVIFGAPLAHRGLHNPTLDENSLPAFKAAVAAGFGIELDIHLTKDEQVVVIHDYTTTRVTGVEKKVVESTYAELLELDLLITKTKIPLLREVLDIVDGKVPILIELKAEGAYNPKFAEIVIKELESYKHKDTLGLQSFNPYLTKELKLGQNEIIVGQLASNILEGQSKLVQFIFRTLLVLHISKPDFFNYEVKYIKRWKIQRKRRKLPLITWTITNEAEHEVAKKYADNIIFENIKP